MPITEHTVKTRRHTTFYLAAGPENGPLIKTAVVTPSLRPGPKALAGCPRAKHPENPVTKAL